jgi:hypothetical protein
MSHEHSRAVVPVCVALLAITIAASAAMAQSAAQSRDGFSGTTEAPPKREPVDLGLEAPSRYLMRDLTKTSTAFANAFQTTAT